MFDVKQMEYVLAIAETGSIKKAADRMFVTVNALYQQLDKLEQDGLPPIFLHQGGRMVLTDAGKIYVNGARTMLKLREETMERISHPSAGVRSMLNVSVISPLSFDFCASVMPAFRELYPNIILNIKTLNYTNVQKMLSSGEIDLAVFGVEQGAHLPFSSEKLCTRELVLIGPEGRDAGSLPVLLPPPGSNLHRMSRLALEQNRLSPPVMAFCNDHNAAMTMVKDGKAITVWDAPAGGPGEGLAVIPWSERFCYDLVAIYKAEEALSRPMEELLQLVRRQWGDAPGAAV